MIHARLGRFREVSVYIGTRSVSLSLTYLLNAVGGVVELYTEAGRCVSCGFCACISDLYQMEYQLESMFRYWVYFYGGCRYYKIVMLLRCHVDAAM